MIAISDVDTRALVRYIRENGAMNAAITTDIDNLDELRKKFGLHHYLFMHHDFCISEDNISKDKQIEGYPTPPRTSIP